MASSQYKGTVVFFGMDALGHINPILSIARELKRRNYRAIILSTRPLSYAQKLKTQGYELEFCVEPSSATKNCDGNQALKAIMAPLVERFRAKTPQAYEATYRIDGAVGKHLYDMMENHDLIEAKMKSLKPDLIIFDHVVGYPCATTVAPRWARLYSGFPSALYSATNENCSAGLGLKVSEMSSDWKQFEKKTKSTIRNKLREFWTAKGLSDWPLDLDLTPTSPFINFYLGPQELGLDLVEHYKPLPKNVWFRLEHTIDGSQTKTEFEVPSELANCTGKLVYFSLGTLVTYDTELINRLLEFLSRSPNKFIVSMGHMYEHIRLHANMWGKEFIDQRAVLSKADLFITHGGHNSIIEAFYYGVPGLIVLPVFADQFDSAQRVEDCEFGVRLNPYSCTENELLDSIESLLANKQLKEQMKKISSRLRSIKYHEVAVNKLEQIIIEGSKNASNN